MIAQTLSTLVGEVGNLWAWIVGIVAGWGLTFTLVVAGIVYAHIRINRLSRLLAQINNNHVTETRDLSLRMRKIEK